jgi:hypothetical protein
MKNIDTVDKYCATAGPKKLRFLAKFIPRLITDLS